MTRAQRSSSTSSKPQPDETISSLTPEGRARLATMPELNAAAIMQAMNCTGEPGTQELIDELIKHRTAVSSGDITGMERLLVSQAHALDSMFAHLVRRAKQQEGLAQMDALLKFALRAQSQCRATVETLATIRNPPSVAFVKQANIANGPQQVNNGEAVTRARENQNRPNELLETPHAKPEWMDARAPSPASSRDQALATMGAIDRPPHD